MKDKLKIIISIIISIVLIGLIGFLVYNGVKSKKEKTINPVATFDIQDYGTVKVELYPEYAPNTVTNFIALIESGYYNNKVIQGKDDICLYMAKSANEDETIAPKISLIDDSIEPDSENDYEYEINGEFIANKFEKNTLRHEKGVLSLNRSDYSYYGLTEEGYNSGNAQFSVIMDNESNLNGVYCAFGKVTEGLEILEKIYNELPVVETEEEEEHEHEHESGIQEFLNKPIITNASVEKYGVDYGRPETHEAFDIQGYINQLYSSYYSN